VKFQEAEEWIIDEMQICADQRQAKKKIHVRVIQVDHFKSITLVMK
ncbi:hypothetical protein TcasGA2_TC034942, partial [Tribolium castaneum]